MRKSLARQMIETIRNRPFIKSIRGKPVSPSMKFRISKVDFPVPREAKKYMRYPLIYPFAYAVIRFNPVRGKMLYHVIEPVMSEDDKKLFMKIKDGLLQLIDISLTGTRKKESLLEYLEGKFRVVINKLGLRLSEHQYNTFMYYIYRDFVGLNEIEPLMNDKLIEDIGCDGVGIPIYVVHRKFGSLETNVVFDDEEKLAEFVIKLAERCNRYISYASPMLDGSLPDGSRVQATLSREITTHGPTFSIRKFKEVPISFVDLLENGTVDADMLAYLWLAVENGMNIMIVGGVSTGKTTLLNAISLFIPQESKIVTIEDTRELNLPHENWIPAVVRSPFSTTGVGKVDMYDLLKESFRQNPDYIIVGEVRGREASVLFQAMSSGHPSISTMHGTSIEGIIKRLETPPIELPIGLIESLDMVITMTHAREISKSSRRVREIDELISVDPDTGKADYNPAFRWNPAEDRFEKSGKSVVLEKISKLKGFSMETLGDEMEKRKKVINWLREMKISDWKILSHYISLYSTDKQKVFDIIEG